MSGNYQDYSASAEPPSGGQQVVNVSCSVLVASYSVQAQLVPIHESGVAESVLVLQLNLNPPQHQGDDRECWVETGFSGPVKLQHGNAIHQVEIVNRQLGNLTIQVS